MNKTIFQLDYKVSVIIVSILGIFIGFVSNAYNVNGGLAFVFHFVKLLLLTGAFFALYLLENKNKEFKDKLKYVVGDLFLLNAINLMFSIFVVTHIISPLFIILSGIVSLYVIFMFVMEIVNLYFENSTIGKVMNFNKKIGDAIATPITRMVNKSTND